ncbi:MAG: HAMP domain-containing protein, partial [Actinoplanes sp.]
WITKPVRALEGATRQLADDDTEPATVRIAGGPPDLRRLAATFNRTALRPAAPTTWRRPSARPPGPAGPGDSSGTDAVVTFPRNG